MARVQVDIKPCHQSIVRELQAKLGGVSAGDAIGFLLETQSSTALARLSSEVCVPPPFVTSTLQDVAATHSNVVALRPEQLHPPVKVQQNAQQRHQEPQPDAASVLDSLMGN